jgi:hypothetical protein
MDREELVLTVLSAGGGSKYTPVQIQKVFFLVDKLIGEKIGGPFFKFVPYHYGPFDKSIYADLDSLKDKELVRINSTHMSSLKTFSLTDKGIELGQELMNKLGEKERKHIDKLNEYVRTLSFSQLVSSIYKAFPEMKKNSIFID